MADSAGLTAEARAAQADRCRAQITAYALALHDVAGMPDVIEAMQVAQTAVAKLRIKELTSKGWIV